MGAGKENKVQAAITGALEVYCRERNLRLFPPYANQQGGQKRKYCVDLLGVVEGADLIALEIKELHAATGELKAFNQEQHEVVMQYERLGVPVAYAYNVVETLPYYEYPKPQNWDIKTLDLVNRATPTSLPGAVPAVFEHQSILEWLNGTHSSFGIDLFGRVHGALSGVEDLRNGILVLLYSVPQQTVAALQSIDILRAVHLLKESASVLSPQQYASLQQLMGASANVFSRFMPQVQIEDDSNSNSYRQRPRMS